MPLTQSAGGVDGADPAQLPRLSSARANNSASFGSFPAVSRISRLKIQPLLVLPSFLSHSAKDVLAVALGMPKDLISLCFFGKIELTDGKRRVRARSRAPARSRGGGNGSAWRQFVPQMDADDGKQGQSTYMENEMRQHAAAFVGQAVQYWSMIRKSGYRFSEKIMLKQKDRAG
jgi:hypothetical protein